MFKSWNFPQIKESFAGSYVCVSVRFRDSADILGQNNWLQKNFLHKWDECKMVSEFDILAQKGAQNGSWEKSVVFVVFVNHMTPTVQSYCA